MNKNTRVFAACAVLVVVMLFVLLGRTAHPAPAAIEAVYADETSSSLRVRPTGIDISQTLASVLLGKRATIQAGLFSFGQSTNRIGGGVAVKQDLTTISEPNQIVPFFSLISTIPVPKGRGGIIADSLEHLARLCRANIGTDVYAYFNTDCEYWDVRDETGKARLQQAFTVLAGLPNLKFISFGPALINGGDHENWRGEITKDSAILGESRVCVFGDADADKVIARIQAL